MPNISFFKSASLLPRSHLLLQFWTHVGVMSHIPAPVTLNLANVLHLLPHGCFIQLLDKFIHYFLLMLNYLLCHDEKSTLSGVMITSFTHKTCDLSGGTFFTPVNFFTIGTSILGSFIGVSYFSANFAGMGSLKVYRPLRQHHKAGSQQNLCELLPSNLPS